MVLKRKAGTKKRVVKTKLSTRGRTKEAPTSRLKTRAGSKAESGSTTRMPEPVRVVNKISPPRIQNGDDRKSSRGLRVIHQYKFMKAPGVTHDFQVGDRVEVFCDHEKGRERVRGWIAGIVVQVDNKMVAVQFRSNVYLTDGWMVPDRILWYPLTSEHIRPVAGKKTAKRDEKVVPDY